MSSGVAYECTAISENEGQTYTAHYWVHGDKFKIEMNPSNGITLTAIVKDDKIYTKSIYGNAMQYNGVRCDWIMMEKQHEQTYDGAHEYDANIDNFEVMSSAQSAKVNVECHPSTFGDDVFNPEGNVCDLSEMMGQLNNGNMQEPPQQSYENNIGPKECNGLSGQEMMDCLQNYMDQME